MPAQVTTRAQVNGYRFLIRRLEHALIRADSRMIHDPMRGQIRSLLVGLVIAVLITGAAGVLAFFKPSPNIGNAQILLSTSSGGLYVRIGDRLHPVLNLASARLTRERIVVANDTDDVTVSGLPPLRAGGIFVIDARRMEAQTLLTLLTAIPPAADAAGLVIRPLVALA